MTAAADDLKSLGVDQDTAEQQAMLREDIRLINNCTSNALCSGVPSVRLARQILWCFEAYEQGFFPHSREAAEIKNKWLPGE
jgi:hypothetical protein